MHKIVSTFVLTFALLYSRVGAGAGAAGAAGAGAASKFLPGNKK
jgi:hypothetical protein